MDTFLLAFHNPLNGTFTVCDVFVVFDWNVFDSDAAVENNVAVRGSCPRFFVVLELKGFNITYKMHKILSVVHFH